MKTLVFKAAISAAAGVSLWAATAFAQDPIRTIQLLTRPQAAQPAEFQAIQLIA